MGGAKQFSTTDPGAAQAYLAQAYVAHVQQLLGSTRHYRFEAVAWRIGAFRRTLVRQSVGSEIRTEPLGTVVVIHAAPPELNGDRARLRTTRLLPLGKELQLTWDGQPVMLLSVDPVHLGALTREVTGFPLQLGSGEPHSTIYHANWLLTMDFVDRVLHTSPRAVGNAVVTRGLEHLLAYSLVATFPSRSMLERDAGLDSYGTSGPLQRAVDYLDDHVGTVVAMRDVARAAGVSQRQLQNLFHDLMQSTPTGYLRGSRLRTARAALLDGDPANGTTVAGVARAVGFAHLGHFARLYQQEFGELPHQTLHRRP